MLLVMKLSKVRMQSLISWSSIFSACSQCNSSVGEICYAVIEVFPSRPNKYIFLYVQWLSEGRSYYHRTIHFWCALLSPSGDLYLSFCHFRRVLFLRTSKIIETDALLGEPTNALQEGSAANFFFFASSGGYRTLGAGHYAFVHLTRFKANELLMSNLAFFDEYNNFAVLYCPRARWPLGFQSAHPDAARCTRLWNISHIFLCCGWLWLLHHDDRPGW